MLQSPTPTLAVPLDSGKHKQGEDQSSSVKGSILAAARTLSVNTMPNRGSSPVNQVHKSEHFQTRVRTVRPGQQSKKTTSAQPLLQQLIQALGRKGSQRHTNHCRNLFQKHEEASNSPLKSSAPGTLKHNNRSPAEISDQADDWTDDQISELLEQMQNFRELVQTTDFATNTPKHYSELSQRIGHMQKQWQRSDPTDDIAIHNDQIGALIGRMEQLEACLEKLGQKENQWTCVCELEQEVTRLKEERTKDIQHFLETSRQVRQVIDEQETITRNLGLMTQLVNNTGQNYASQFRRTGVLQTQVIELQAQVGNLQKQSQWFEAQMRKSWDFAGSSTSGPTGPKYGGDFL